MQLDYTVPVVSLIIVLLSGLGTATWFIIVLWAKVNRLTEENILLKTSNQELKTEVKEVRDEFKSFINKVYEKLNLMAQGLVRVETKVEWIEKRLEND